MANKISTQQKARLDDQLLPPFLQLSVRIRQWSTVFLRSPILGQPDVTRLPLPLALLSPPRFHHTHLLLGTMLAFSRRLTFTTVKEHMRFCMEGFVWRGRICGRGTCSLFWPVQNLCMRNTSRPSTDYETARKCSCVVMLLVPVVLVFHLRRKERPVFTLLCRTLSQ